MATTPTRPRFLKKQLLGRQVPSYFYREPPDHGFSFAKKNILFESVLGHSIRLRPPATGYQPQINLVRLSRKSIIFPTISMESFEDSPDADRHGGHSILR